MDIEPYKRRRFTLLDLLVAVGVLCILFAITGAYVQSVYVRSRRDTCTNHLRNIAQVMTSSRPHSDRLPAYLNVLRMTDNSTPWKHPITRTPQGASWAIRLMPWLELDTVYTSLRSTVAGGAPNQYGVVMPLTASMSLTRIEVFRCPSDPRYLLPDSSMSYVVNAGCRDTSSVNTTTPRDWVDNGVSFDHYSDDSSAHPTAIAPMVSLSVHSIPDGAESTLLLSENMDAGNYDDYVEELLTFTWDPTSQPDLSTSSPTVIPPRREQRINVDVGGRAAKVSGSGYLAPSGGINTPTSLAYYARPSSFHPGGVNVVYCDVHTQFLSGDIDYYVYGLLMSSNGSGVKQPGISTVLPNWDRPIQDDWIHK